MNKDSNYENSAVNLCNPDEVRDLLVEKGRLGNLIQECQRELEVDEIYLQLLDHQQALKDLDNSIRLAIEKFGSYQEIGKAYGVKYTRRNKLYNAIEFKSHFTKFAPAVIEETVNAKALEGLIKGKLLTDDELEDAGVLSFKETFAFYIDVGE